ncbi:MAG: hypothetical protein KC561_19690 [Myxococcales bacterium]|nr:hypothetical protein [Myxococcales bacterium]
MLQRLLSAALLAFLVSGCTETESIEPQTNTSSHPLEGDWRLIATRLSQTCDEYLTFSPVPEGAVRLQRDGAEWELTGRDVVVAPVYSEGEEGRWHRSLDDRYERCDLHADTDWTFSEVGMTRFESTLSGVVTATGPDCQLPVRSCEFSYQVRGFAQ